MFTVHAYLIALTCATHAPVYALCEEAVDAIQQAQTWLPRGVPVPTPGLVWHAGSPDGTAQVTVQRLALALSEPGDAEDDVCEAEEARGVVVRELRGLTLGAAPMQEEN
jgi:hypothetical protein